MFFTYVLYLHWLSKKLNKINAFFVLKTFCFFLLLQSYALNVDLALQRHNIYIITIIIKL